MEEILLIITYIAVIASAISGALEARKNEMDIVGALNFLMHTRSKFTNASFYSNPVLDKIIDESLAETNPERRLGSARVAQKILIDDAVWGFLWYDSWTRVMRTDVTGIEKRWDTFERYYGAKRA